MKESLFIKQNKEKWIDLEKRLDSGEQDPDKLSDLFIQVSDDLSYARTFYPNRSVRLYLNNLTQKVYSKIYKNRRSSWADIVFFWKEELPKIVWDSRKELTISMFVFILSVTIGVFSAIQDSDFVRMIISDDYVNMTIENIDKGDPMAVYKKSKEMDMFMGISLNNIKVDFITFASGLFLGIGSIVIMFYNGIMVGVFQYFFIQKGLFAESALTIWLHGTLEMAGMVLAGAAGIRLGTGLIFPGTYSRMQSFQRSAMNAFKLLMGTLPVTLFAAIIESFLTRYTETPDVIRFVLILLSLVFIIGYFIIYPIIKKRQGFSTAIKDVRISTQTYQSPEKHSILNDTELIRASFSMFHHFFFSFGWIRTCMLTIACLTIIITLYSYLPEYVNYKEWIFFNHFFDVNMPWYIHVFHVLNLAVILTIVLWNINHSVHLKTNSIIQFWIRHFYKSVLISLLLYSIVLIPVTILMLIVMAIITPALILILAVSIIEQCNLFTATERTFRYISKQYSSVVGLFCMLCIFMSLYYLFIESPFTYFFIEFILLNFKTEPETIRWVYISFYTILHYTGICFLLPLCLYGTIWKLYSLKEIKSAAELIRKIQFNWPGTK